MSRIFEIRELNARIRDRLATDLRLCDLWARGELSNVVNHRSGHRYFTLKDEESQISCVLFKNHGRNLDFELENGMNVLVFGDVGFYSPQGRVQILAKAVQRDSGQGRSQQEFERLKRKLAAEGIFDEARKRPLPPYPRRIGVVTSPDGAALRDVIRILGTYPAKIIVSPAQVQGESAPESIASAVEALRGRADVAMVCRGGGSAEDLWPFNSEIVARAISRSDCPMVSAVGHETDVTIADFAADVRAATPSAAAELVKPDLSQLREDLKQMEDRMARTLAISLERRRSRLDRLERNLSPRRMRDRVNERRQSLERLSKRLGSAELGRVERLRNRLDLARTGLNELSPLATLSRGYAIALRGEEVIRSASEVDVGEDIDLILAEGRLRAEVKYRDLGGWNGRG